MFSLSRSYLNILCKRIDNMIFLNIFLIFLVHLADSLNLKTFNVDAVSSTAETATAATKTETNSNDTETSSDKAPTEKPRDKSKDASIEKRQKAMLVTFSVFLVIFAGLMFFIYVV
jgi:hypothetical protein